jgi:hypothetical protein
MKMINGRNKGANGEREAAEWLATKFNLGIKPERNLEQVRKGGHDLLGFPPFAFEIKRAETLNLRDWWLQAVHSCTDEYHIPVVMYRQNRRKWQFLISAQLIGVDKGYIHLEEREFILWATKLIA